jgi:hypothetical protein
MRAGLFLLTDARSFRLTAAATYFGGGGKTGTRIVRPIISTVTEKNGGIGVAICITVL